MADQATFDPEAILRVLHDEGVELVVVGGMAAVLHGSAHVTTDIDITPRTTSGNLERLSTALRELGARIRVAGIPDGLEFDHDGASLARAATWNLTTVYGDLDITCRPDGTEGWEDLHRAAVVVTLHGVPTSVAALADVVRSKEAADRPKDRIALPGLRRLLAEQTSQDHGSDETD